MNMSGILVGIDGSEHSRRALEWAIGEAAIRKAPLTVLTVNQAVAGYLGNAVPYPGDDTYAEAVRKVAQEETEEVLGKVEAGSRPSKVEMLVVTGLPAEEILKAATDADMIVVGTRGAGGFRKLLVGSVTSQVTHHAHCPVVIIPDVTS